MSEKREQRRGLGRGLSALMADVSTEAVTEPDGAPPMRPDRTVPVDRLLANRDQPRRRFDDEKLQELANSLKAKGVLQPLIVRPAPDHPDHFEIVAGERRWRAAQMAQIHDLPVIVRDFSDDEVLEVAIVENIQRADLNPIEEAAGYRQLMLRFGHTQEQMAEALGKSRSHIANLLRLLSLPDEVQDLVTQGALSAGHARTLVTAARPEELAAEIVKKGLSVRAAEKLAKAHIVDPDKPRRTPDGAFPLEKDADTKALQDDLSAALGMKVTVDHKPGKESGRVTIGYDTLEQLDALCMILSATR